MSFPSFANQAVAGAKQDAVHTTVGSQISSPKFVDNAFHHAVYTVNTDTTTGRFRALTRPASSDFQVTLPKAYNYTEQNGSLLLTHSPAPGVKNDTPIFFNDNRLSTGVTPPLMLFSGNDRILPESVSSATDGSKLNLTNMKGRTLEDLGLSDAESPLYAGQTVEVGLRTSDLAMRCFRDKKHGLNSISLALPFSGSRSGVTTTHKGATLFRHSGTFLSRDLRSATLINALRFMARHDHYTIYHDRFGNLVYAPDGFLQKDRNITNILAHNIITDPVIDASNRVIVTGKKVALNSDNEAHVDDMEVQKRDGVIKTQVYTDPTASTRAAARKTANHILRLNRKAQGSIRSTGHFGDWDLQPGDVVGFRHPTTDALTRSAVVEATHSMLSGQTDLQLMSYEVGMSDLLNTTNVTLEDDKNNSTIGIDNTLESLEMSAVGPMDLRAHGIMAYRQITTRSIRSHSDPTQITLGNIGKDIHSGFIIGHRHADVGDGPSRSAIGTGLTLRLTGGSFNTTTVTVSSTTGFPSSGLGRDFLLINESIQASYSGKTSTTFTGVSVVAPSGATIPATGLSVRLLRTRAHEVGTVKSQIVRKVL